MPKTHVLMVQEQFVAMVMKGKKDCTIRGTRKRAVNAGDTLDLRCWTGLPYRSKQRRLRTVTVTRVRRLFLHDDCIVLLEGVELSTTAAYLLADSDGFKSLLAFFRFFEDAHGLPFFGHLIEWNACP